MYRIPPLLLQKNSIFTNILVYAHICMNYPQKERESYKQWIPLLVEGKAKTKGLCSAGNRWIEEAEYKVKRLRSMQTQEQVSQHRNHWHWRSTVVGAILCTVRCLAAPLASTHWKHPPPVPGHDYQRQCFWVLPYVHCEVKSLLVAHSSRATTIIINLRNILAPHSYEVATSIYIHIYM